MKAHRRKKTTEWGFFGQDAEIPKQFRQVGNAWWAWTFWSFVLQDSATLLGVRAKHEVLPDGTVRMPMMLAVRAMLLAYAIECAFKALWVRRGKGAKIVLPDGSFNKAARDHDLVRLAHKTSFTLTAKEEAVLRRLSTFSVFAGRYPIALSPQVMIPDALTKAELGFVSPQEFRFADSIHDKIIRVVSGKKRDPMRRWEYRQEHEVCARCRRFCGYCIARGDIKPRLRPPRRRSSTAEPRT